MSFHIQSAVLSSLNHPAVLLASAVGTGLTIPVVEKAIENGSLSFASVKIINGLLYGLNVLATSQPGRIDGQNQEDFAKDEKQPMSKEMEMLSPGNRGRTLVAPSGWAFAIWGPIFIGELIFVAANFALNEDVPVAGIVKRVSGGFMASQIFQTLWSASFRPKFKGKSAYMSAAMLSGIALSLSRAHDGFASADARSSYSNTDYLIYFLPLSLHFGWTTAASIVNLNGSLAMTYSVSAELLAWGGHLSVVAATAVAVSLTLVRQAPVYGGVIAWALTACADGMKKRIESTSKEDSSRAGVYGAKTQRWLCLSGAMISAATSIFVAIDSRSKA